MTFVGKNLKDFTAQINDVGYRGALDRFMPPKINPLIEEHRASGMDSPLDLDMGIEKLTTELRFRGYYATLLDDVGLKDLDSTKIEVKGALEDAIDGEVENVTYNMTGKVTGYDPGDWLAGTENSTVTLTLTLVYLKITVNGAVKHEIDVLNAKRIVNGVDQRANINAALHAA